jgi:hypothetical protein
MHKLVEAGFAYTRQVHPKFEQNFSNIVGNLQTMVWKGFLLGWTTRSLYIYIGGSKTI